jgi:hypothetical protein
MQACSILTSALAACTCMHHYHISTDATGENMVPAASHRGGKHRAHQAKVEHVDTHRNCPAWLPAGRRTRSEPTGTALVSDTPSTSSLFYTDQKAKAACGARRANIRERTRVE